MKTLFTLLILTSIYIGGCAQNSGVLLAKDSKSFFDGAVYEGESKILAEDTSGGEQYRVFQQAATGFIPGSIVREEVEQQAIKFCDEKGKSPKLLQEKMDVPPYILGNFPRAELLFICIPRPQTQSFEDILYVRLTNLKKLLDAGTITKDEFERNRSQGPW